MEQWFSRAKMIFGFAKTVSFFLCIAVFVMMALPWKGAIWGNCAKCVEKTQYLQVLGIVYGVITGIVSAFVLLVFVLSQSFNALFRKFPFLQSRTRPMDQALVIVYLLLSSGMAFAIMSAVVYRDR